LMASATVGIVAQRLARRICTVCKTTYMPDQETLDYLGWPQDKQAVFYRGAGCDRCNGTGYKGRCGIYEVMRMNADLRKLVARGAEAHEIHAAAVAQGML